MACLQEFHPSAVDQLLAASEGTRGRFLDMQFVRNRRLKNAAHRARLWFTTVDKWLVGTRDDPRLGLDFFGAEVSMMERWRKSPVVRGGRI
jgi:hypothetical protein